MDPIRFVPLLGLVMLVASCAPKETKTLLDPAGALGAVLAEQAVHSAGNIKTIALITPDASWGTASTVEVAFRDAAKKMGVAVVTVKAANLGDPMRRGQVGLKAQDFLDALLGAGTAGAVVSVAGAPRLSAADAARVPAGHPPVLVVATAALGNVPGVWASPEQLSGLLDAKIIQIAVVDGADSSPPAGAQAGAVRGLFARNYHLLGPPN